MRKDYQYNRFSAIEVELNTYFTKMDILCNLHKNKQDMIPINPVKVLFFAGQSGSGKGTQKELLLKYLTDEGYELATINNGDLVRSLAEEDSVVGRHVKDLNKTGGLVATPLLYMLVCQKLKNILNEQPNALIIWDGSPRRVKEADDLADLFCMFNMSGLVIHIDVPDKVCLERMKLRQDRPEDPGGKIISYNVSGNGADTMRYVARRRSSKHWPFVYKKIDGNSNSPQDVFLRIKKVIKSLQAREII